MILAPETPGPWPHTCSLGTYLVPGLPGDPLPPCSHGSGHSPPLSHTAVSPSHMPLGRHCRTAEPRRVKPSSHSKLRLPPTGWDPSRGVYTPFSKETGAGQRTAGGREGDDNTRVEGWHLDCTPKWVIFSLEAWQEPATCQNIRWMPVKLLLLTIGWILAVSHSSI